MYNFTYHNPTKIVFGKGTIAELKNLLSNDLKILLTYGGGSIKKNGVYDQVMTALKEHKVIEYGGIEPNPQYRTCMQAVRIVKNENIDFILSVGGGSVLDASKFIAAAALWRGDEPWDFVRKSLPLEAALPLGCVLTLPATGSESNPNAVISREETGEKLAFIDKHVFPQFAILDPETTYTLPERQVANGVVDTFVHVIEQYLTFPVNAPLQDRLAESILLTLVEEGPKALQNPLDYDTRATLMWAATLALNTLLSRGVPTDWTTHQIGHELTALHGIDHARTLAIFLPAVLKHQKKAKFKKLAQYGRRVWGLAQDDENQVVDQAIAKTIEFFKSLHVPVCLADVNLTPADVRQISASHQQRGSTLGEHGTIGPDEIAEIILLAA
ncbi:iron-containing alcohol dehydrogenase [candidate division KSB1 bacterium]|nr:iron-containing alcohol dehydrogenase [candidate division KSB1 bacterium]RQW06896.1 MAG: iron-containing alcohol dehydrogenase [candidate division KSB1 bacterium]